MRRLLGLDYEPEIHMPSAEGPVIFTGKMAPQQMEELRERLSVALVTAEQEYVGRHRRKDAEPPEPDACE